jgi:hypothetical protein
MIVPSVENCFIKVSIDGREEPCGRPREKPTDLCCADHWQLVPKKLRVKLIDAGKVRSLRERERLTICAATEVVEYLKAQKIQLPPAPKLVATAGGLETKLGPLVKVEPGPRIVAQSKLIIPGR